MKQIVSLLVQKNPSFCAQLNLSRWFNFYENCITEKHEMKLFLCFTKKKLGTIQDRINLCFIMCELVEIRRKSLFNTCSQFLNNFSSVCNISLEFQLDMYAVLSFCLSFDNFFFWGGIRNLTITEKKFFLFAAFRIYNECNLYGIKWFRNHKIRK